MKKKIFIVAAVIISSQLKAQLTLPRSLDTTGSVLDEVVLTSNKYPKKQSETGKVITIINRQQLDKSSGRTIGELLNTVSGTVIIGANNNLGTNLTASIRGASSGNLLILIDGIPVNDPSVNTNYFDLNLLAIDQIERIEILKGGQSTLYGSDAVAGVINIISRKPGTKNFNINGGLSGGSYNTYKQNIGVNGSIKSFNYTAAYTHISSKGLSSAHDRNETGTFDDDGIDQHIASARLGFTLSKNLKAHLISSYSFYKTDLDASAFSDEKDYVAKNDNVQAGAGLTLEHKTGALRFNYHFNYIERDYFDDSVSKGSPFLDWAENRFIGRTHYAELYDSRKYENWELLAGIDYRLNNTDQFYRAQFPPFAPGFPPFRYETSIRDKSMSQLSPYASVVYKKNAFTAEMGGRLNVHSEYGSNFTFTINPSYLLDNKIKLFANLYSAFKTPTLYQLFDPSAGNTELDPEKGIIGEAGTEVFCGQGFRSRIVGFYRHSKDAIVYTYNPSTFENKYQNVSKQKNYGAELELSYSVHRWSIAANYTYTDGKITSGYNSTGVSLGKDTTYFNLYRIPKNAFNLNIGWQASNKLFISTQLRAIGKREEFIFGAPPESLKGYATIGLYGEYAFSKKIKTFIDLKNITNKEYFDIQGYTSRRFNFMAGLNFNL